MNRDPKLLIQERIWSALAELLPSLPQPDVDGDWPVPVGERMVFVRPSLEPVPGIIVFAGVARSIGPEALSELNSLNGSAAWVKFLRADNGDVFVQQRLPLSAVSVSSLALAIHAVGSCANDTEPMLAAMFGGFSAETDVPDVA